MSNPTAARETPQQTRSKVRREQLLAAAREIVLEEGIDAITTAKIAERADASIGTVYRYWSNVYAILDEILPGRRQTHDVLLERAEQVAAGHTAEKDDEEGIAWLLSAATVRQRQYHRWIDDGEPDVARARLVAAAALFLSALEVHDREHGTVVR